MASSYPTSLDTFTNPTSGDNLDSPDHATQHADVNDAVEALEAKVGTGNSPASSATAKQVMQADGAGGSAWSTVAANDLSDVDTATASPSVGDALVWDGANWVPDSGTYVTSGDEAPATAMWLPGTAGNYVSTPDHADLDPADDIEFVWRGSVDDYTSTSQTVVAKRTTGDGLAYQLEYGATSGDLVLSFRSGASDYWSNAVAANPGWVDGTRYWFRVRRDSSTGAVTAHYAADQEDEPSSWTALTVTGTQTSGAIDGNAAGVEIGTNRAGTMGPLKGELVRVMIRTAFGGANVADFRADAPFGTRFRDTTGKMWTANGSGWAFSPKG